MAAFLTASLWILAIRSAVVDAVAQINITAQAGDEAILPCAAADNRSVRAAEWIRKDLGPELYVILYRNGLTKGQFDPEQQDPSFKNRVDLPEARNGNVSLMLRNVTTNDTGTYECVVIQEVNNRPKRAQLKSEPICIVNLDVLQRNKEGQEDGGSGQTRLIIGVLVTVICLAVIAAVAFTLWYRKKQNYSLTRSDPPSSIV